MRGRGSIGLMALSGHGLSGLQCWLLADSVEKVQFRERSKICGGAGAFIPDLRGGPHHQRDFKWATVASTLQGIALTKIGFGMRSAKFCGHIIFEFFNTIDP